MKNSGDYREIQAWLAKELKSSKEKARRLRLYLLTTDILLHELGKAHWSPVLCAMNSGWTYNERPDEHFPEGHNLIIPPAAVVAYLNEYAWDEDAAYMSSSHSIGHLLSYEACAFVYFTPNDWDSKSSSH